MSLLTDLLAYWQLDETSGTRFDAHASYDAAETGTVGSLTGIINNGADFPKSNSSYLEVASGLLGAVGSANTFSLSFWVKPDTYTSFPALIDSATRQLSLFLDSATSAYLLIGNNPAYFTHTGNISTGAWHHVVVTWNGGTNAYEMWVDGVSAKTGTVGSSIGTEALVFGANPSTGGSAWDGGLDEFGIWTRVLTNTEVGDLYNSGAALAYSAFGGGGVSVALTGQSVTSSAGTVAPSTTVALSGQSVTVSAGTLTPSGDIIVALTGQSVAASAGTLTPSTTVALTGQSVTTAAGTLAPSTIVALSGQSVTTSAGTLAPSTTVALTGQSVTVETGFFAIPGDKSVALTGSSLTVSPGTLTPSTTVGLTGQSLTVTVGTVTVSTSVALSGQSVTISAGTVTAPQNVSVALSGQSVTTSAGTVVPSGGSSTAGGYVRARPGGWSKAAALVGGGDGGA